MTSPVQSDPSPSGSRQPDSCTLLVSSPTLGVSSDLCLEDLFEFFFELRERGHERRAHRRLGGLLGWRRIDNFTGKEFGIFPRIQHAPPPRRNRRLMLCHDGPSACGDGRQSTTFAQPLVRLFLAAVPPAPRQF